MSMKIYTVIILCCFLTVAKAQYAIQPEEGFTPQIGTMVSMLEDIKNRITEEVEGLNQQQTDFLFDDQANSIGAMIMHLAATEAYYQTETLEQRPFTDQELEFWAASSGLGAESKEMLKGNPISYYLDLWDQVRQKTLKALKTKDDQWFAANIEDIDEEVNNHWVWFHVLEHQASHMGQIVLVKTRFQ